MFLLLMCVLTVAAATILLLAVHVARKHRGTPLFFLACVVILISAVITIVFLVLFLSYAIGALMG